MFWRKKKQPSLMPTGRVIDMTRRRWGHNFEILNWWSEPKNSFRAAIWVSPDPHVGDVIRWTTSYGTCYGIITKADWTRNVSDMFFVDVTVTNREFNDEAD